MYYNYGKPKEEVVQITANLLKASLSMNLCVNKGKNKIYGNVKGIFKC